MSLSKNLVCRLGVCSCVCALGRDRETILSNLRARASGLVLHDDLLPGHSVYFGGVNGPLPLVADPSFDSRTNRLLLACLESECAAFDRFLSRFPPDRVAVVLGTSNTGVDEAERILFNSPSGEAASRRFKKEDPQFPYRLLELGAPAEFLARELGVTGPHYAISTACSSAAKAFAAARRLIAAGVVDAAIVGGADGLCRFALRGFAALEALSRGVCRPLADDRDGINLGEGAALFTLERDADDSDAVLLLGAGETSDAYHPTAPDPEGRGAEAAMRGALADGGVDADAVAYVNLHGTGTPANDAMETAAVRRIWPNARFSVAPSRGETASRRFPVAPSLDAGPFCESTKDLTGHCLGAAGAVEAALVWIALAYGDVQGCALSNSFAFGGSNCSLLLKRRGAASDV